MAEIVTMRVNTVAGNTRLRVFRILTAAGTDTVNVGGGGIRMAKIGCLADTDLNLGMSRESTIDTADKNNEPGRLAVSGAPTATIQIAVTGVG